MSGQETFRIPLGDQDLAPAEFVSKYIDHGLVSFQVAKQMANVAANVALCHTQLCLLLVGSSVKGKDHENPTRVLHSTRLDSATRNAVDSAAAAAPRRPPFLRSRRWLYHFKRQNIKEHDFKKPPLYYEAFLHNLYFDDL